MSASYLPAGPDNLVLPEGQIGESAADLLHDFVHPNHRHARFDESEATLEHEDGEAESPEEEEEHEDWDQMMTRPWYRRPSSWWCVQYHNCSPEIFTSKQAHRPYPVLDDRNVGNHRATR